MEKVVDALLERGCRALHSTAPEWVRDVWINGGRRWSDIGAEEYLVLLRRNGTRNAAELGNLQAWWLQEMISTSTPLSRRIDAVLAWAFHFCNRQTFQFLASVLSAEPNLAQARSGQLPAVPRSRDARSVHDRLPGYGASNKAHPNENYARELLELFSLGVGNYTEKDILEVARAFTGWDLDAPPGSVKVDRPTAPDRVQFPSITRDGMVPRFQAKLHDDGTITVLGRTEKTFGVKEVLDIIVEQPACGRHVAGRMIEYFGVADPEGQLRERMAKAFKDSRYEIRPMLRILFTSPEFYAEASRAAITSRAQCGCWSVPVAI